MQCISLQRLEKNKADKKPFKKYQKSIPKVKSEIVIIQNIAKNLNKLCIITLRGSLKIGAAHRRQRKHKI